MTWLKSDLVCVALFVALGSALAACDAARADEAREVLDEQPGRNAD